VKKSSTEKSAALQADAHGKSPRRVRLLVVEDSESSRSAICEHLREEQFDFEEAENGAVALEKFKAARFDLILMDIRMPMMDGYEAMRRIREWEEASALTRTPILAFSASSFEEDIKRSMDCGADLHVAKPVKKDALAAAIRGQLRVGSEQGIVRGKRSATS